MEKKERIGLKVIHIALEVIRGNNPVPPRSLLEKEIVEGSLELYCYRYISYHKKI